MDIEDLDEIAKRIFERCMPAKEEIEKSPEKTKFLEAFPGLEYSTIGPSSFSCWKVYRNFLIFFNNSKMNILNFIVSLLLIVMQYQILYFNIIVLSSI